MTETEDIAARRPVAPGVLHDGASDGTESYLVAVRCPNCGLVQFPGFWICPRCIDRAHPPEPFRLRGDATLDRFCVAERGPSEFNPPYVLGYVRLAEGPVVYSLVRGVDPARPELSQRQPMKLIVEVVRKDENGVDVVGWVARPER